MNIEKTAKEIIEGNFNSALFINDYQQAMSPSQLYAGKELTKLVSSLLTEKINASDSHDKVTTLNDTMKKTSDFLLLLNESDYVFALNVIKNDLLTIPQLCTTNSKNEVIIEPSIEHNVAYIISENPLCSNTKAKILVQSLCQKVQPLDQSHLSNNSSKKNTI